MGQQARSLLELSIAAAGAITIYRGVGFDGNQATVQGQAVLGPARFAASAGDEVTVVAKGTAVWEVGAAITVGEKLIVDNQGRVIPANTFAVANPTVNAGATAVTSTAANGAILTQGALSGSVLPEWQVGTALQAASAAGQFIEVLLP